MKKINQYNLKYIIIAIAMLLVGLEIGVAINGNEKQKTDITIGLEKAEIMRDVNISLSNTACYNDNCRFVLKIDSNEFVLGFYYSGKETNEELISKRNEEAKVWIEDYADRKLIEKANSKKAWETKLSESEVNLK